MKKRNLIVMIITPLLALAIFSRIYLPIWLTGYVNTTLDNIPGYSGSVGDIHVHLYRGAYLVKKIELMKTEDKRNIPFVTMETMDISIDWKALLEGGIVAEVNLQEPVINFIAATKEKSSQTGEDVDWTERLKKLLPLTMNRFTITGGTVVYHDLSSEPEVHISLNQLELMATNISNVEDVEDALPSTLKASAISVGNGQLTVDAKLNLLKKIPDIDLNAQFEEVTLPALNDFLKAYLNVDAESGNFFLYTEIVLKDGKLRGYVKPILTNVSLVDLEDETKNVVEDIWEMIVATVTEIFENQPEDQLATKVPLEGDLNSPDAAVFTTVWNVFRNAFIEAFSKNNDGTVRFSKEEVKSQKQN